MLTEIPSQDQRKHIHMQARKLLELRGAVIEAVERYLARREMGIQDLLEFRDALVKIRDGVGHTGFDG